MRQTQSGVACIQQTISKGRGLCFPHQPVRLVQWNFRGWKSLSEAAVMEAGAHAACIQMDSAVTTSTMLIIARVSIARCAITAALEIDSALVYETPKKYRCRDCT